MPVYQFKCQNEECLKSYEKLTKHDDTGIYKNVVCPYCHSDKKTKEVQQFSFSFANPVGTDKWNNSHDYRFYHNLPNAKKERETAQKMAKSDRGLTSSNPYRTIDDISSGENFGEVK